MNAPLIGFDEAGPGLHRIAVRNHRRIVPDAEPLQRPLIAQPGRDMGESARNDVVAHAPLGADNDDIERLDDGHQVRDILDVSNAVEAYLAAWQRIEEVQGRVFNLGGGPQNAVSLRQLLDFVGRIIDRPVDIQFSDWRAGDQRYFVADTRALDETLGLAPRRDWRTGVADLARWLSDALA